MAERNQFLFQILFRLHNSFLLFHYANINTGLAYLYLFQLEHFQCFTQYEKKKIKCKREIQKQMLNAISKYTWSPVSHPSPINYTEISGKCKRVFMEWFTCGSEIIQQHMMKHIHVALHTVGLPRNAQEILNVMTLVCQWSNRSWTSLTNSRTCFTLFKEGVQFKSWCLFYIIS